MPTRLGQLSLPVVAIEGIGRRRAAELNALGVFTVGDLLRVEPGRLRQTLGARRSLEEVRSWYHMAAFLQIRVMTPQWAEALYRSRVYTPRDLLSRDLPGLQRLFRQSRAHGVIPDVPRAADVAQMMKEAAEIEFTGAVNGTILDQAGDSVAGANVCVGREQEISDERGRFRVVGIPFRVKSTLAISHPDLRVARYRLRNLRPSDFIGSTTFRVRRLAAGRPSPNRILMEASGDSLPPIGDARVGQREVERDELQDRDIFALTEFAADRQRGKLVSKLLAYEDGAFWLPYVWVPVAELQRGAKSGDTFVLRRGAFEPIQMDPIKLRGWPAMLKTMREMGPPPASADEVEVWLARGAELMQRAVRRRDRH